MICERTRTSKPGPAEHAQNDGEREVILDRDEHGEDEQNGKGRQRHEHVGDHADDLIRPSPAYPAAMPTMTPMPTVMSAVRKAIVITSRVP